MNGAEWEDALDRIEVGLAHSRHVVRDPSWCPGWRSWLVVSGDGTVDRPFAPWTSAMRVPLTGHSANTALWTGPAVPAPVAAAWVRPDGAPSIHLYNASGPWSYYLYPAVIAFAQLALVDRPSSNQWAVDAHIAAAATLNAAAVDALAATLSAAGPPGACAAFAAYFPDLP